MQKLIKKVSVQTLYYGILLQSTAAMFGSLFFSDVMKLPPCVLCWYQRIAMYPVVALSAVAIVRKDAKAYISILALAIPGFLIAFYHNMLYWNWLPGSASPCMLGVSCTTKFFALFGFITIPFLSLMSFVVVIALAVVILKKDQNEKL